MINNLTKLDFFEKKIATTVFNIYLPSDIYLK